MAGDRQGRRGPFRAWILPAATLLVLSSLQLDEVPRPPLRSGFGADPDQGPLDRRHLGLVINASDPLSEAIGQAYQRARLLPDRQVIRVHFRPGIPDLRPRDFLAIKRRVDRLTPPHVQVYALAWAAPYRVGCQSITSAFSFGLDRKHCADGCRTTALSPYFARGDVRRPWDQLRLRPTMLLAASSEQEARRLIDRGVASDGTAPPGTAYLLSTSDPARNTRSVAYGSVERTVGRRFGVRLLRMDALVGADDVMAYFTGLAFPPGIRTNRYRPGAVADHLTSLGGRLTDSTQMSALRWLEAGATASYGTVVEPCNFTAKFPDPGLLLAYYLRGDTLIESYWRSVAMPGQGVFIGEPLARPWPFQGTPLRSGGVSGATPRRAR